MKTSITAFAALLGYTSAQNFLIINSCSTPVYFQPIHSNGSASGPLNTVQPAQSWSEAFRRPDGSTVKIGTNETLDEYLSIWYNIGSSDHGEYIFYELSTQHGNNPFASHNNSLLAKDGCPDFRCKVNETYECYSTSPHHKINGCKQPFNLTAHLCH